MKKIYLLMGGALFASIFTSSLSLGAASQDGIILNVEKGPEVSKKYK